MLAEHTFSITVDEKVLNGIFTAPREPGPYPAIVICHGFKGFMEWGFFPYLAELLAQRGYCAVRFNFSGSGMRPGDDLVTDPGAFREATFSGDLRDLLAVIDGIGSTIAPEHADRARLGLLGHSRGGGIALLAAAEVPSIRALVTWAAVSTFDRLAAEETSRWRRDGELAIVNSRTGQELTIGVDVLTDLEARAAQLNLEKAAGRRRTPWLIVHGNDDETVPVAEARCLTRAAHGSAKLHVIADGDHTLGARHPFRGPTPALIEAMNGTQTWLRRYLSSDGGRAEADGGVTPETAPSPTNRDR